MFFENNVESIDTTHLHDLLSNNLNLIDVREEYEFVSGRVPGARNIPVTELVNNHNHYLNNNDKYFIICQSGARSIQVVSYLRRFGYNVVNVSGGTGMYSYFYKLEV